MDKIKQPKKDGWYLAWDGMIWDRMLYKKGKWVAQTRTRESYHIANIRKGGFNSDRTETEKVYGHYNGRDDMTKYVTQWQELPDRPEEYMDKIREEFETLTQFMENVSKKLNCLPDYTGDYQHIYKAIKSRDEEIKKLREALEKGSVELYLALRHIHKSNWCAADERVKQARYYLEEALKDGK